MELSGCAAGSKEGGPVPSEGDAVPGALQWEELRNSPLVHVDEGHSLFIVAAVDRRQCPSIGGECQLERHVCGRDVPARRAQSPPVEQQRLIRHQAGR